MNMHGENEDLLDLLAQARRSVPDDRSIWCVAADGFETTLSYRTGLLLGGASSPLFLRSTSTKEMYHVPFSVVLFHAQLVVIETAIAPMSEWLPLMQDIQQSHGSLLLVTQAISSELVKTLCLNWLRDMLSCCVVRFPEDQEIDTLLAREARKHATLPPKNINGLPTADEVWIRRTASVLFSASDEDWWSMAGKIAVISVGGESFEDQRDRLRFLMWALQTPLTPPA